MKVTTTCLVAALTMGLLLPSPGQSYEVSTHAAITQAAYGRSVLSPTSSNSVIAATGLDRLDIENPFQLRDYSSATNYHDEFSVAFPADFVPPPDRDFERGPQQLERFIFSDLLARQVISGTSSSEVEQRISSWLMRGAIREDDNDVFFTPLGIWVHESTRDDDPYGGLLRASKHFFDPIHLRAYDFPAQCQFYQCRPSISWALGRTNPLDPTLDQDDHTSRNHFNWQTARNNYWWALTLKRDVDADGYDIDDAFEDMRERMSRWATTFKSIGQVIHLLQDTAQPQHVRNDAHAPPNLSVFPEGSADAAFEAFTDYRLLRSQSASFVGFLLGNPLRRMHEDPPALNLLPPLRFGPPYPASVNPVQFSTPVEFFTTRHIESGADPASILSRRGLADLSNRNFLLREHHRDFANVNLRASQIVHRRRRLRIHCRLTT